MRFDFKLPHDRGGYSQTGRTSIIDDLKGLAADDGRDIEGQSGSGGVHLD
jgi:hypothetical protein